MKRKIYDDDDGRTIADMSGIERRNLLFPRRRQELKEKPPAAEEQENAPEPVKLTLSREERKIYALGAVSAGLVVGLVFILGLGLVVLLFYLRTRGAS